MLDYRGYYNAERAEGMLFVALAFTLTLLSIYIIYKQRTPFAYGLISALIMVACLQAVLGASAFIRSPNEITRVEAAEKKGNQTVILQEIPRIEKRMSSLKTYSNVEIFLMILGVLLMFFMAKSSFYAGIGVGLLTQSTIMLVFNFFAEKRSDVYLEALRNLNSV